MAITIKSEREIELMAEAGKILERVHNELEKALRPGMSTKDIDTLGEEIIRSYGCIPSFLNYNGYPASICVSVNQEVVHGIPDKHRIIQEGDIVSLDAGVIYKGYHSDAARTHAVGRYAEERGYGVVRDLCGHGIGTALHEAPEIPNYEVGRKGVRLRPGMTLAIEPMINMGRPDIFVDDSNGWTIYTDDRLPSAQREIMVLVTETGHEVLAW